MPHYLGLLCHFLWDESKDLQARELCGLQLKNTLVAKDAAHRKHLAQRWLNIQPDVRMKIKQMLCEILKSQHKRIRSTAALVIGQIARVEINAPENLWKDLVPMLVNSIKTGNAALRQSSFETLGYVCEECPKALQQHSNEVLTAIHSGMRPEETNNEIKHEATKALANALEFIKGNMDKPEDRRVIMGMVFDSLKCPEHKVREAAYQCLIQLAVSYYQYLGECIGVVFELTKHALQHENDELKPYAIEIWCSICEEEMEIMEEIEEAKSKHQTPKQTCQNIIQKAQNALLPLMLICLTKQQEDVDDDTVDAAKHAGLCISLISQTTRDSVVAPVVPFIHENIVSQDWRFKEAAILAFGCILEGPSVEVLKSMVEKAFPLLLGNMNDQVPLVKDTTAWCIGQICKFVPETISPEILHRLMETMVRALDDVPKIACNVAWAIHNLADVMEVSDESETTPLSPYLEGLLKQLLKVTQREDAGDANLLSTTYEAINVLIRKAAKDRYDLIGKLLPVLMDKLRNCALNQGLTGEESERNNEIQGLLCASVQTIVSKLGKTKRDQLMPVCDELMRILLRVLQTKASTVHEDAIGAIGAVAQMAEKNFERYMREFMPYLVQGLKNIDEIYVCQTATGAVTEVAQALGTSIAPFADQLMQCLLDNLQSADVERTSKPQIVATIADIALQLGPAFDRYLFVVMSMLISASQAKCDDSQDYETQEYILLLREAVLEAFTGIVTSLGDKVMNFAQYLQSDPSKPQLRFASVCGFLDLLSMEQSRDDSILRLCCGLIGDVARYLGKNVAQVLQRDSVVRVLQEANNNPDENVRAQAQYAQQEIQKIL